MQIYGLCFIVEQEIKPIPLQNVTVEANIVDMIAEVTISQAYKNIEKDTIEALYKFPIYEAAAICGFEAEIDGQRKVKGIVKEAKEAAKEYTEAIQEGHGAYLLESESEDVFQCSVGNITSEQTVVIKITYVTELKHDSESEKIRFVLPTNIAPRYGSSEYSSSSNDGKILNPDVVSYSDKADFYLELAVTCRMTSAIQNIESPSHKISTEMNIDGNPKISKITLTEQITYLEKDFILVVKSKDLDQPRAFVEYDPELQTNCIMLTLVPKFSLNTTISELVFVVDRSGSMDIEPMKKAAQALELLLRSLPEDCYFNVVSFGSDYDSLFPKSELYSETSLSKALNLAQTMKSNYGGTEVYNVLEWVFKNSRDDMPTSIFLITDGEVWNVDQIVELVSKHEEEKNDDLRLFSLGIGDSVSHNLVESVARAGKGYAQFVTNDERMDKKVIGMLKNALKPPIKDYNITWTEVNLLDEKELDMTPIEVDKPTISFMSDDNMEPPSPPPSDIFSDIKVQQAPYIIPPIYSGVRFIVYCILEKNIEPCKVITLKATSQDGPMKLDIPLDTVTLQGSKVHRLAARKLIQDLNDEKSFIHKHPKNANKHIPDSLVKGHIVKLGKTFNLASKYTSFIATDERNNESLSEAQIIPQKREVPQLITSYRTVHNLSSFSMSSVMVVSSEDLVEESPQASQQEVNVIHQEPKIENLFEFLGLQSFDGKFLPNKTFYEFFYKNYLDGFNNFKQEIEKELSELSEKEIEEILTSCIAIAYLKIVMFDDFKDECEMCYEKAEKVFKKMIGNNEKEKIIIEKAEEWIKNWVNNSD
ncbi:hypothetical protein GLOIN_2v1506023 [Rhizophagus irregularis DAOM 181602=DAOM 197198]|uniref:von willebrand domain-containing protein n=1 Tax=Rhizophagus irregularis (strain DAOM 181602 / DAOM 197198 / MUCL 43194) TaxID=747089 RepID=A0A2P4QV41_RHIID|nr:hypothetical protein GLOIN_2v1506023 [Rhizophagus irregularis DAOM 181602=DAOM 197198]PKY14724.1 hypothetical protein RhiirB3_426783 [Rhizophagus irregularis]POG81533.1 hypothetical protein GLOIN_2v1506023 [Rhizophagus irregularis DAOM 181602=DAOM 197198]|eukprot:XP_025188399.1 hypothetical protein GLOIN_2v1506023 [Rhizophagus irregularis DAOM 181602=DAOM 197198]